MNRDNRRFKVNDEVKALSQIFYNGHISIKKNCVGVIKTVYPEIEGLYLVEFTGINRSNGTYGTPAKTEVFVYKNEIVGKDEQLPSKRRSVSRKKPAESELSGYDW